MTSPAASDHVPNSATFGCQLAAMRNAGLAFVTGLALWSWAGWAAHPRELWDVPAFWPIWGLSILAAGILGIPRDGQPLRDSLLLFLPILGVLTVQTLLTGGSASLLPLGLIAVAVLALPGWLLAALARRLTAGRS